MGPSIIMGYQWILLSMDSFDGKVKSIIMGPSSVEDFYNLEPFSVAIVTESLIQIFDVP